MCNVNLVQLHSLALVSSLAAGQDACAQLWETKLNIRLPWIVELCKPWQDAEGFGWRKDLV